MTNEAIAAISALDPTQATVPPVRAAAGVGFTLNDLARFENAMAAPNGPNAVPAARQLDPMGAVNNVEYLNSDAIRAFLNPLERINSATERFMVNSEKLARDPDVTPGEMMLTMVGVQKFVLECQLTSSVANRTSDGIQELFRQQS
jgi:hypothetical protein